MSKSTGRVALAAILVAILPFQIEARTRKGDRLLAEAQIAEKKGDWPRALTLSEQAIAQDASDPAYELEVRRVRFEAAQFYVSQGQKLRAKREFTEALAAFRNASEIDPSLDIADQEIRRTKQMVDGKQAVNPQGLTPAEAAQQDSQRRIDSLLPAPELKPMSSDPISLRMWNQRANILFDTLGKLAGINVLFDPDYIAAMPKNQSIDLNGSTLTDALDAIALVTRSYWKPINENTIFVTQDSATKRHEYETEEVRVFYLSNVTIATELQEIMTTLRQVAEVSKVFNVASQNAIVVRAEPDRMAIVEKIVADLDKRRSEVLVDVTVMEVNSTHSRQLAAAFAPTGISSTISFTPRSALQTAASSLASTSSTTTSTTSTTSSSTTTSAETVPLSNLLKIDGRDFSLTNVPGGLLEAIMSDAGTRVLQRPQIRAVDSMKAVLKIGDRVPTASGSYSSGVATTAVSALVSTQFTYIDTGVNLELTPRVHDDGEVSMHVDVDISQVSSYVDLGGIEEPVISQRRATVDVRMRDGQINIIGGLLQLADSKTVSGVPGLASIPLVNRLFTSQQVENDKTELLISIVPHIVRAPEMTVSNLAAVQSGDATNFKVRHAMKSPPALTSVQ